MGRKTDIAAEGHGIAQASFSGARYERENQMLNASSSTMPIAITSTARATES
jgi:hypothetical protein